MYFDSFESHSSNERMAEGDASSFETLEQDVARLCRLPPVLPPSAHYKQSDGNQSLVSRPAEVFPSRHLTDLSRWPLFSVLPADMVATIKKLCVFGSAGNEAIFITESDDVYAFGSNCSSCLGLGECESNMLKVL